MVLSQLQIGLAAGCAIVACLTAFGGGVIVGMWYKASEQTVPLSALVATPAADKAAPGAGTEAASQAPAEQPVTFYNTLTGNQAAYAPLTPPPAPAPASAAALAPVKAAAPAPAAGAGNGTLSVTKTVQPPVTTAAAPREVSASSARPAPAPTPKATAVPSLSGSKAEAIANAARAAAASEAQKSVKAAPPQKPAPTAPAAATPTPKVVAAASVAPKPAPRERQPAAAGKATSREDYSVQVGSFGSSEQAERLRTNLAQKGYPVRVQLSEVPGQGMRYRVRVGNYADRASADQSAHHLTAQEQVPAIVAGKN